LPADFDFINLFHGVDERVPVGSLVFGAKVVDHILQEA
jgi:acetylornithine deacetylase/succinyl-diaminopimelate desuccinylase-like protein